MDILKTVIRHPKVKRKSKRHQCINHSDGLTDNLSSGQRPSDWGQILMLLLSVGTFKEPSFCRISVALFDHGVLSLLTWAHFCWVVTWLKKISVSCFSRSAYLYSFMHPSKELPEIMFSPQQSGTYNFGGRQVCSARPRLISAPSTLVSVALCASVLPDSQCGCWVWEKTQKQVKCLFTYARVQHPIEVHSCRVIVTEYKCVQTPKAILTARERDPISCVKNFLLKTSIIVSSFSV